ncbi:MAG: sigma-70 family RNA polymerase sigma factor [Christensenellaceae bacterium]|nr:sigma-70 family RNA polymerase sigma factor [Christensenellaceae bacterium]
MNEKRSAWLEQAIASHEPALFRLCFAYLGDAALAEDAVQETFVKAYKGYDRYCRESEEKTWLTRIAINTCKDIRKSAWFRHVDRSTALESLPEEMMPFTERDDTLIRAVMGLKPRLREVVLLHDGQGLTAEETANALGIARSTMYKRLTKAHQLLRKELEAWYHDR